ncbi:diadenylate cyclase CdaA [Cyanobacterium sp. Dongsha4]|uniref:diadenylate cyclase CdaA n=1 Tax=Cyanobacterium sp. DS4 TaxID=2878255 RepID=UPI002E814A53|nr:diadenylate cyclase CdaA [Cyanobacterium sp. Dongsha4]WVL01145.1 diadenylate cyclase CdaA [Cyanobacterium sp. Dongsha4]
MFGSGFPDNLSSLILFFRQFLDLGFAVFSFYYISVLIRERRAQRMIRGLFLLFIIFYVSDRILQLKLFSFFLERLILICSLSLALVFQSDFRRFLEQIGRWQFDFSSSNSSLPKEDSAIDEMVEAVKDLSQNRVGALIIVETFNTLEERIFVNPGVQLNAIVSKELLQTIFQTKSLLHDGAVFVRGNEVVSAGVILPLSDRSASRQLGTRHRAAMGITERVDNCLCIVVSEETGSISLGEKGTLNRPLTSTKLKELLEEKLSQPSEGEVVTGVTRLSKKLTFSSQKFLANLFKFGNKKKSLEQQRKRN